MGRSGQDLLQLFLERTDPFDLRESSSWCSTDKTLSEVNTMTTTIVVTKDVTTLINVLTVELENQQKLIDLLSESTVGVISKLDGWISTSFIAGKDGRQVVIYSQWRDLASVQAMQANPEMVAYFPKVAALATFNSVVGDVVYNRHA
jgi:quinol monooxygenase YgiN